MIGLQMTIRGNSQRAVVFIIAILLTHRGRCLAQATPQSVPDSIESLQRQLTEANDQVNRLLQLALRPEEGKQSDEDEPRRQLQEQVRKVFELQLKVHKKQLDEAELRIASSRQVLQERQDHADEIIAARTQSLLEVPADAASPNAVLEAMERYSKERDYQALVGLLTNEETQRLAGLLLQQSFMMKTMLALMDSTPDPVQGSEPIQAIINSTDRFMRHDPSPESLAAYRTLTQMLPSFVYQLGATDDKGNTLQRPNRSAKELSELYRKASGVLTDARAFCSETLRSVSETEANSAPAKTIPSQWDIVVDGDHAIATQMAKPVDQTISKNPTVEMRAVSGRWKISQLFNDSQLMTAAAGPTATLSVAATTATDVSSLSLSPHNENSVSRPSNATANANNRVTPGPAEDQPAPYPPRSNYPTETDSSDQNDQESALEWTDFLERLPAVGAALVMFHNGTETATQMSPLARRIASEHSMEFVELPIGPWKHIVSAHANHLVLLKDRILIDSLSGPQTEKRILGLAELADNWLSPKTIGIDASSFVRVDCYINPGHDKIGSQLGGIHSLTSAVVANDGKQVLLLGPESIADYIEKGYACIAVAQDVTGETRRLPLDVIHTGPVPLLNRDGTVTRTTLGQAASDPSAGAFSSIPANDLDSRGSWETGAGIYLLSGSYNLTAVRLAAPDEIPDKGENVLSVGFRNDRHWPPLRNILSPLHWQSQTIRAVDQSIYGNRIGGPCSDGRSVPFYSLTSRFYVQQTRTIAGPICTGNAIRRRHVIYRFSAVHDPLDPAIRFGVA